MPVLTLIKTRKFANTYLLSEALFPSREGNPSAWVTLAGGGGGVIDSTCLQAKCFG